MATRWLSCRRTVSRHGSGDGGFLRRRNGSRLQGAFGSVRGLTARDLAAKASISASYLSQIESGVRDGSFETIKKIAAALRISVDDLA
ncbi:helix-turn-helix transcriptional regulator [Mesorhizobium sp. CAU 1732]|uniref:helix-turn-helix domain-containing protein n=1 Tax=Mesorhizobium sp. CAU 1732 TaxID=3140358 RepID=UPI003261C951